MVILLLAASACRGGSPSTQTREKGPRTVSQMLVRGGVSLELPAGWEGRIYQRPTDQLTGVQAANSPLALEDNDINEAAQRAMGSDGILLILLVADGPPGRNVHTGAYLPTELTALRSSSAPGRRRRPSERSRTGQVLHYCGGDADFTGSALTSEPRRIDVALVRRPLLEVRQPARDGCRSFAAIIRRRLEGVWLLRRRAGDHPLALGGCARSRCPRARPAEA